MSISGRFGDGEDRSRQAHYQAQHNMEELPLRSRPPSPSGRLNRKTIGLLIAALAFVLFIAVLEAFTPPDNAAEKALRDFRPGLPSEAVTSLPSDYSALPKPKLGPLPRGMHHAAPLTYERKLTDTERFLEEQKLKRMKRAAEARNAGIVFSDVRLEDSSRVVATRARLSPGGSGSPSESTLNPRDEANRQDEKRAFIAESRGNSTSLARRVEMPASPYQVMAGTVIPALLLSGINSDLPGPILGQVSQNVYDSATGKYLLIPQGTKLVGEYDSRISFGQERVLIVWTRLVFPDGASLNLEGMPGADAGGLAGLKDKVNNHYGRLLSGVLLGSVISAGAQVAQGGNRTINPSFGQLAVEGAAQNVDQVGQQITRRNLNVQPTIEIRAGLRFTVFVTRDLDLGR